MLFFNFVSLHLYRESILEIADAFVTLKGINNLNNLIVYATRVTYWKKSISGFESSKKEALNF